MAADKGRQMGKYLDKLKVVWRSGRLPVKLELQSRIKM